MSGRRFVQVDVFGERPLAGNPVAVVLDGDGLDDEEMQALAAWTNLSETTFVQAPAGRDADYAVRIFTPTGELPFAGHPTLGTCHAWLESTASNRADGLIVQECGIGRVALRRGEEGTLAFAAPPARIDDVPEPLLSRIVAALGLDPGHVEAAKVIDNGPVWHVLRLSGSDVVLGLQPDMAALASLPMVGVVGPHPPGGSAKFELRAFAPVAGAPEDPATGSLNAGVAQWLIAEGIAPTHYIATQGQCVGRAARIAVDADDDQVWIGGSTLTVIEGTIDVGDGRYGRDHA